MAGGAHGKRDNIGFVSCDFREAYPFGVRRNFPNVRIVYNKFHAVEFVIKAMNDTVRRAMKSQAIKARYPMRMKISKLSGEQLKTLSALSKTIAS